MNLDEIEALAMKATPGPWSCSRVGANVRIYAQEQLVAAASPKCNPAANAAYIAAADPQAVLALIAEHRALTAERDRLIVKRDAANKQRGYAIRWANQSVELLQGAFFPVADALRALEAYLRDTPHHNAPEAAAARKAIATFDRAEPTATAIRAASIGAGDDGL